MVASSSCPRSASCHVKRRVSTMRTGITPGGTVPDYELPDHTNALRRLSELQGENPLILTLARGHFCPKEHQQHLELAAFYPKIAVGWLPSSFRRYRARGALPRREGWRGQVS